MVSVSKKWIKENVKTLHACGGQVTLDDIDRIKVPKGGFETTLTSLGKEAVEHRDRKSKFHIAIPRCGWADAFPESDYY